MSYVLLVVPCCVPRCALCDLCVGQKIHLFLTEHTEYWSRWVVVVFFFFFKGMGGCRNSDLLLLCHLSWLPNGPGQLQSLPQQLLQVPLFHSTFSTWIPGQATTCFYYVRKLYFRFFFEKTTIQATIPLWMSALKLDDERKWHQWGSDINSYIPHKKNR